jgi:adenylate cyclase
VRALTWLSAKFSFPLFFGLSANPEADLKRADELASRALALDPNYAQAHSAMGAIRALQGRLDESTVEHERALALDPAWVVAIGALGWNYYYLGQFEKTLEFSDRAIRLSPHDPALEDWYRQRTAANFALKRYDQAIEWARRAIAIKADNQWAYFNLIAALALTGREAEAHQALQNYFASVPSGPRTIAAWKEAAAPVARADSSPRYLEVLDRTYDGLRKAGLPEE